MKIRAFITHKKAEHFLDCQDRFSVNVDTKSIAVSDGMSQSIFQKIWAEILVDAYTKSREWIPSEESDHSTVKTNLAQLWKMRVNKRLLEMQEEGRNIIRTENSLALGGSAGATIVGVRFDGNKWRGDVLGDSCLLEVKDSKILRFLTSQDGEGFDNHPDYYDSNPNKSGKGKPKFIEGELSSGMSMFLVSDPFSDFFIEQKKNGNESQFVDEILSVNSHEDFENLVSKWRAEYGMHNDDSTLLIIEPDGSDDLKIHFEDNIEKLIEEDAVATPTAPANPFHLNTSKPVEESKSTLENSNVSKSSYEINEKIEIATPTKPSSIPTESEMKFEAPSGEVESSAEPVAPPSHLNLQNTEDEISRLQINLDAAYKSSKQAQGEVRNWENKCKILQTDKEALEIANARLEDDIKRETTEKKELEKRNAELIANLDVATALNKNLEKEKEQFNARIDSLKNEMQNSDLAHKTEISRKDQEIKDLRDKLSFAQKRQVLDDSEIQSLCLEVYEKFLRTQPWLRRRISGFDQHDIIEIVNQLLEGPYLIIKR